MTVNGKVPARIRAELTDAASTAARLAEQFKTDLLSKYPTAKVDWKPNWRGLALSVEGFKFPRKGRIYIQAITPDCATFCHVHPGLGVTTMTRLSDFLLHLEDL
ncbi:hypothetical protein [Paucibacter soli]|uniref:hypothetical protein n=1 Tax=Paucibacter soli TaxID=3133433 RepID=UPI00309F2921